MSADAQTLANYTGPVPLSSAVAFFRTTPRWPTATDSFKFSFDYLTPVALTALIPLIFATVLLLALVAHLIVRFTCRYDSTNHRQSTLDKSPRAALVLIPFSASLLILICIFTSLGLLGNAMLNHSSHDVMDVLNGLLNELSRSGFAVVDVAILLRNRINEFNPSSGLIPTALSASVGDLVIPTLLTTQKYIIDRYPDVQPLREALSELRDSILNVFTVIRRALNIVYAILLGIILLLLSAPPLLRLASAKRASRACAVSFYLLYMFIPALLAWALVGVLSAVGATVADVCYGLSEYRDHLRGEVIVREGANAFVDSGFVCPAGDNVNGTQLRAQIEDTAASVLQSDLARTTIQRLLNTSASDVAEAASWTAQEVPRYIDCTAQIAFAGQLQLIACGRDARSAVDGVLNVWVSFLGLAICLSIAVFASLCGVNVLRALDIWATLTDDEEDGDGGSGESELIMAVEEDESSTKVGKKKSKSWIDVDADGRGEVR